MFTVSPHIGSDTTVATHGAVQMCVANITAYLRGARPPNLLNPRVLDRIDLPG